MADPKAALAYASKNREHFLDQLKDFIRIPSISTDPEAKADIQRAAEWLTAQLEEIGMQNIQILPTDKHPVVYAEWLQAGPDKPTVLIYGHYDVQPAEPLELWESPAFEPTRRGDNLYARGASDMKGQVMINLKAVDALMNSGGLPVNVKFFIEGEEEVGSPSLPAFLPQHKELFASDFALNTDTGMLGADQPAITYGLRGLAYFEIRVSGPDHDLHSGLFGGAVHNPAQVLCELIAGMHDGEGRITLPGFYDSVRSLTDEERVELARLPLGEDHYLEGSGAPALYGEAGYTAAERVGARPTLEVNGMLSGFTGEGQKTVLPSKAMAKISMRLVPDQDPEEVYRQLMRYIRENTPQTVNVEVLRLSQSPPSLSELDSPQVQKLAEALDATFGHNTMYKREGGSVPVVAYFQQYLGIDSVCSGFGLPDDNLHAPNEKLHLPTFYAGIDAVIRYLAKLGED